jgi:hypothetical protein
MVSRCYKVFPVSAVPPPSVFGWQRNPRISPKKDNAIAADGHAWCQDRLFAHQGDTGEELFSSHPELTILRKVKEKKELCTGVLNNSTFRVDLSG